MHRRGHPRRLCCGVALQLRRRKPTSSMRQADKHIMYVLLRITSSRRSGQCGRVVISVIDIQTDPYCVCDGTLPTRLLPCSHRRYCRRSRRRNMYRTYKRIAHGRTAASLVAFPLLFFKVNLCVLHYLLAFRFSVVLFRDVQVLLRLRLKVPLMVYLFSYRF